MTSKRPDLPPHVREARLLVVLAWACLMAAFGHIVGWW
jgi:hypothetical protein